MRVLRLSALSLGLALVACSAPAPTSDGGPPPSCDPNPCSEPGRGVCRIAEGSVLCRCDPGLHEDTSGACVPETGCSESTCGGHGACSDGSDGPICACELGYAGRFCETCDEARGYHDNGSGMCTLSPCDPSPCTQEGRTRCVVIDGAASCECDAGLHLEGDVCVPDATCTDTSCNEHGACSDTASGIVCDCEPGWAGERCSVCDEAAGYHADGLGGCTTDLCLPNPCTMPHASVCDASSGSVVCACDAGYHRELDGCVIDEVCDASSCDAHGACSIVEGRVACACDAGYEGARCDACAAGFHDDGAGGCTDDACVPSPCTEPHRSVCTAGVCSCDAGYHDDGVGGCTTDPCVPDPCAAMGMACRDGGGSAECYVPPCDDANPCTDDRFDGTSCVHDARIDGASCSTTVCMRAQTCTGGVCGGGTPVSCDDANPCTDDACDAVAGCAHVTNDARVPDDGVACTVDRCASGVASHMASDAACDDGAWCDGVERCAPSDPSRDARGCITTDVPVRPRDLGPCRRYGACDEATDSFPHVDLPAGASCDDRIACTSGDACDASGVCRGTPTASCSSASCTSVSALSPTIDIPTANVSGTVTLGGATLPTTSPSSGGLAFYLVAKDTGALHELHSVYFGGCCGSYSRSAGTERYATRLVPGVYDLLFSRNFVSGAVYDTDPADPFVNGRRILRTNVVVPAGTSTLDIDVPAADVHGTVTLGGAALPTTSPSSGGLGFYLVARDTGELHELHSIYFGGCCGSYTRSSGTETYATRMVPGTYDLLYSRNFVSGAVYDTDPADPFVNGRRILRSGIVIGPGTSTLDIDIPATNLSGTITLDGAALPTTSPSSGGLGFYLVARDTGELHELHSVYFGGCCGSYTRSEGTERYATRIVPGTYDLLYSRNFVSGAVYDTDAADPFVNGRRILQSGIVISSTSTTLDIDIPSADITGTVTLGGAALPTTSPSSGGLAFYLVAHDTGELHELHSVYFGGCCGSYSRSAGTETYATRIVPGTYDLLYSRNFVSGAVYDTDPADPFVNGRRVLRADIVVPPGASTLDIDIPVTNVAGTVTLGGAALPTTSPSSGGLAFYLVARDTGELHELHSVYFGGCCGSYSRSAGTESFATRMVPGTYDLLYSRNFVSGAVYATDAADPFVNGRRILREGIVIGGASARVDIDIPVVDLAGTITLDGAALPTTSPSSGGLGFQLVARDTSALHALHNVYFGGCCGSYTRSAGSEAYATRMVPGVYDLLFSRNYVSGAVYDTDPADPFVNGRRELAMCIDVR